MGKMDAPNMGITAYIQDTEGKVLAFGKQGNVKSF